MPRRPWRAVRAALAAALLVPALLLIAPPAALACSCAEPDTEQLLGYADTVAVGELTAIEPPPARADGNFDSSDRVTYTASVETVLKGDPDQPLVFRSASHGASCGLEGMQVGQDYVFFVRDGESTLCDGTARATEQLIAEVEAVTGPGQPVAAPTSDPDTVTVSEASPTTDHDSGSGHLVWVSTGVAALILVVLGGLIWRRRSTPGNQ